MCMTHHKLCLAFHSASFDDDDELAHAAYSLLSQHKVRHHTQCPSPSHIALQRVLACAECDPIPLQHVLACADSTRLATYVSRDLTPLAPTTPHATTVVVATALVATWTHGHRCAAGCGSGLQGWIAIHRI